MTKFLQDFSLENMAELQSYHIHELLDKTKYEEKEKMKKHLDLINKSWQKLMQL